MGHFPISIPVGGAVPNFGIYSQIGALMKHTKFRFDWSKFGRDYSLRSNFESTFGIHNIITFEQKSIQKISLASSVQLNPTIIWDNFGKNWTDFQGGVAKRLLSIYFNTADRRCFGKWQTRHFQNQHNPGNKMTSKVQIWDKILKVMHFFKDRNISRTVGGAVFILLWYVQDMMLMIPTDFCDDMSNGSEDMKMYDTFQNGRQGVQSILA